MAKKNKPFPNYEEILEFIKMSPTKVGKRELARAFNLKGQDLIKLKIMLRKMADNGMIQRGRHKKSRSSVHLPPVLTAEVSPELTEEGEVLLIPLQLPEIAVPIVLIEEDGSRVKSGDHLLVRVRHHSQGYYTARILKKIPKKSPNLIGAIIKHRGKFYLQPSERKRQEDLCLIDSQASVKEGQLVLAEMSQQGAEKKAKILKILGTLEDPRTISLISIFQEGIPYEFPEEVLQEAEKARSLSLEGREDLRSIPFVTIDGEDARDFDDAVWAHEDPKEGWHLMVAIADVSYYVKPGSSLDKEAYLRGNSVYFPDRVVPMLPEALSNELCSLRPKEDKACFAVHLWLDTRGRLKKYEFVRGVIQSVERLTYSQVQKAIDGTPDSQTAPILDSLIRPLYGAYALLQKAREYRGTLDLELPEKQVIWNESGHIEDIHPRPRLDSHRLIEEFMILANVAAAQQLEALHAPCIYRIHDEPDPKKIFMFREVIEGLGFSFPKSQAITPRSFLHLLKAAHGTPQQALVSQLTLRTQAQALYHPKNIGHFGLSLKKYSHFTSPIRRYADIVVHRSLIQALKLGEDGLPPDTDLGAIGEQVSFTERRAATAERAALERYISVYMKDKIGQTFKGRINGVASFGFFVTLEDSGADGLVPINNLPYDFYHYEERKHRLVGRSTRQVFTLGDSVSVILREVDTLTGSLSFSLLKTISPKTKALLKGKKHLLD